MLFADSTGDAAALVALGAFVGGVLTGLTALIVRVWPVLTQGRAQREKDRLAREAQQAQADRDHVEQAARLDREGTAHQAKLKREAYDAVSEEFQDLLARYERDLTRRDGQIDGLSRKVDDLYDKLQRSIHDHADCLVKNQQALAKIAVLDAELGRFRTVEATGRMSTLTDAIIVADERGIIREWNASATALFHYSAEEAVGMEVRAIIPPEWEIFHTEKFAEVVGTGRAVRRGPYKAAGLTKGGQRIPVSVILSSWQDGPDRMFSAAIRQRLVMPDGSDPFDRPAAGLKAIVGPVAPVAPPKVEPGSAGGAAAPGTVDKGGGTTEAR